MKEQNNKGIQITKLDAAVRQLETAIVLWFNSGDSVSIHTLSSAAFQIIYDLNKHQNGPPMSPDSDIITPEGRKEWKRALKAWSNFMKHADNDPTATLFFKSDINEHIIIESIIWYSIITKETRPIFECFRVWMLINESVWFKKEFINRISKSIPINSFKKLNRSDFFNKALPVITRGLVTIHT